MKVIADLCVVPLGISSSVSEQVKKCITIIHGSGLSYNTHGYGTNIEGEWDDVLAVVKQCHEALHDSGVVRISSSLKLGTRTDKAQSVEDKIQAVSLEE